MAQLHQRHTFDVHFLVCPVLCNMVSVVISQTLLHACFLVAGGQQAACKRLGSESLQVRRLCGPCAYCRLLGERTQAVGVLGSCAHCMPAELCGRGTFFADFETGSHSVAQAGLGLSVLLPQPPRCWGYRHGPWDLSSVVFMSQNGFVLEYFKSLKIQVCAVAKWWNACPLYIRLQLSCLALQK